MKLSQYTLEVLKSFANINPGLVIQSGTRQRTMSPEKSVLVEVDLEDNFSHKFGIYDLVQFLGNVTTLSNPNLEFSDKFVKMIDESFEMVYLSCSPEIVVSPPDKSLVISNPDVKFELTNATLSKALRLASMNSLPNLSIVGDNGELNLKIHDKANDTSNYINTKISDYTGDKFSATFKIDNFNRKIMPDDYDVEIKNGAFAQLKSKTKKVTYFIAVETK
jgi:hypothetical protein